MSVEILPPDPNQDLKTYLSIFRGNTVSAKTVELLLAQIARWRVEGIEVYVYRPPTSPEILQAEKTFSGFDERAFRTALHAAGGIWIDVPLGKYTLADGSHITAKEVPEFSTMMARLILQNHESARASTPLPAQDN